MKRSVRIGISIVVILLLAYLAVRYAQANYTEIKELTFVNPWLIMVLPILFVVNYYFIGVFNAVFLEPLGVKLGRGEAFGLALVTGFYNLITPFRGGMAVRAVYLKKKHQFAYTDFLATLAASYILTFLVAAIAGLLSLWWLYAYQGVVSLVMLGIFGIVALGLLGMVIISPKIPESRWNWVNRFIRVANGWHLIRKNKKVVWLTLVLSLLQLMITTLTLWLQFQVFGIEVLWIGVLVMACLGSLGLVIGITPAGLGIQEAIAVFSGMAIGITPAQALASALLGRAVSFGILLVLGPIYSWALMKGKGK